MPDQRATDDARTDARDHPVPVPHISEQLTQDGDYDTGVEYPHLAQLPGAFLIRDTVVEEFLREVLRPHHD